MARNFAAIFRTGVVAAVLGLMNSSALFAQAASNERPDRERGAVWSTPGDGRLVMLMRNTDGFNAPIGVRVRVCVTNLTGSNNSVNLYIWTTGNPWDAPSQTPLQQTRHLDLGECVEIDQPAALIIQDSTTSGIASGYYELLDLPPITAPSGPAGGGQAKRKYRGSSVYLSVAKNSQAKCENNPTKDFLRSCKLAFDPKSIDPALKLRGVRICTGDKFVGVGPSLPPINYPAGYLELIINKSFLPIDKPQDYDYNWNPVTPHGCRDVIADSGIGALLDNIYFRVGPFSAVPPWDASTVQEINVSTQWIYWK